MRRVRTHVFHANLQFKSATFRSCALSKQYNSCLFSFHIFFCAEEKIRWIENASMFHDLFKKKCFFFQTKNERYQTLWLVSYWCITSFCIFEIKSIPFVIIIKKIFEKEKVYRANVEIKFILWVVCEDWIAPK